MVESLVEELRLERHAQRITLDVLAIKSNVSVKHLSEIENHKTKPSLKTLEKISKALGMEVEIRLIKGTTKAASDDQMAVNA